MEQQRYEQWPGYESYAYLRIYDGPDNIESEFRPTAPPGPGDRRVYSLDPDALSKACGVAASRVGRRGDRRRNGRYETRNLWELRSTISKKYAPHEHVRNVLDLLSPGWDAFLTATQHYVAVLQVVIEGPDGSIGIDAKDIARLAALGASLDVDSYTRLGDDE